jgi:hypothetical protein
LEDAPTPTPPPPSAWQPKLTDSMNPKFFDESTMGKAWEAHKNQEFGKENLVQAYMTEPVLHHILIPVLKHGFFNLTDMTQLFAALPLSKQLWSEYQRVKDLDWCLLCKPNPKWQIQTEIDEDRIDMQIAMLFHYNMDLAAVH